MTEPTPRVSRPGLLLLAIAAVIAAWWTGYLIYTWKNGAQRVSVHIGLGGIEWSMGNGKKEDGK